MSSTYTSLCKVSVSHSYYASTRCECLSYNATSETKQLFNKYGMVLRTLPEGFEIYTNTKESIETYLNYITQVSGQTAFDFEAQTNDVNFYNFTDIPINTLGQLTCNSNTIKSEDNGIVELNGSFQETNSPQSTLQITLNFQDIIRLKKANTTINFTINLKARETQWKYYIINNSNQEYNQLEIQSTNSEIDFSTPTEVTLENQQKALLFISNSTKIPLKNEVTYQFNLISTKKTIAGERKETIMKGLPIPNPQNLEIQDDHTIASLIYIYI